MNDLRSDSRNLTVALVVIRPFSGAYPKADEAVSKKSMMIIPPNTLTYLSMLPRSNGERNFVLPGVFDDLAWSLLIHLLLLGMSNGERNFVLPGVFDDLAWSLLVYLKHASSSILFFLSQKIHKFR